MTHLDTTSNNHDEESYYSKADLDNVVSFNYSISKLFAFGATFLTFVGLFGNLISLLVFIRAKQKAPKIAVRKYLILLTASNAIFLLLAWYIQAAPILYYIIFDSFVDNDINNNNNNNNKDNNNTNHSSSSLSKDAQFTTSNKSFNHYIIKGFIDNIHENNYTCKLVNYVFGVCKTLSILLILSFSIERALVICFPLKAIIYKDRISIVSFRILIFIVIISFTLNLHSIYLYELVEFSTNNLHDSNYFKRTYECAIQMDNYDKFYYYLISIIIVNMGIPFFIIITSNIAIVIKLKRTENELNFNELDKRISIETTNTSSSYFSQARRLYSNYQISNRLSINNNDHLNNYNENNPNHMSYSQQLKFIKKPFSRNGEFNYSSSKCDNASNNNNNNKLIRSSNKLEIMKKLNLFKAKSLNLSLDNGAEYFPNSKVHEYLHMIDKRIFDEHNEQELSEADDRHLKLPPSSSNVRKNKICSSSFDLDLKSSNEPTTHLSMSPSISQKSSLSTLNNARYSNNSISSLGKSSNHPRCSFSLNNINNNNNNPNNQSQPNSNNFKINSDGFSAKGLKIFNKKQSTSSNKKNYQKLYNTKMLIAITTLFVLLNLPYFILSCITLNVSHGTIQTNKSALKQPTELDIQLTNALEETSLFVSDKSALKLSTFSTSPTEKMSKDQINQSYKYHQFNIYISITELLYLSHYSLFIIFSLASSRIFRLHLKSILNKFYNLK